MVNSQNLLLNKLFKYRVTLCFTPRSNFITVSCRSISAVATGWTTRVQFQAGNKALFLRRRGPAQEPSEPPIGTVQETHSWWVKQPGKNAWSYTSTPS
jgi:hypothetical protein